MNIYSTIAAAFLLSVSINAESASHGHENKTRSLEAHVHGLAELTVAQEGSEIEINLRSPSVNIVGFEHKASTSKQIHAVEDAEHTLMSGNKNFMFSGTVCKLEHAKVDVSSLLDDGHSEHKDEHAHAEDDHDERHEKGHHDDHDEHKDEHAHAEDDHGETHSEVTVLYHFECDNGKKLSSIKVDLFDHFPGIEKLTTQWVTDKVQGSAELTKNSRTINFN